MTSIDHIVYATPDLEAAVDELEQRLGVRADAGGQHPDLGTRNALLSLGSATYLEVIGPDPAQPAPAAPRPFGLDELERPRLATWVAQGTELDDLVASARAHGVPLGDVLEGGRRRPDGSEVAWRVSDPRAVVADGLVPFFIDWSGASPHPAQTSPAGCTLLGLRAEHPEPERVRAALQALGLALPVDPGPAPALVATLRTPRGVVELR